MYWFIESGNYTIFIKLKCIGILEKLRYMDAYIIYLLNIIFGIFTFFTWKLSS